MLRKHYILNYDKQRRPIKNMITFSYNFLSANKLSKY